MFEITIPVLPVAKGRARSVLRKGKIRHYTPDKTARAEDTIRLFVAREWKSEPLTGPLHLVAQFVFPRPKSDKKRKHHTVKPDLSNLLKLVEDACNQLLWHDDAQITRCTIMKDVGEKPCVYMAVSEVESGQ